MRIDGTSTGAIGGDAEKKEQAQARLVDASQQFEAMLMQEMLKPLQSFENKWDDGQSDGDKSGDTLSAYGTEAVAKAISKAGGLGIAKRVLQQVNLEHERKAKGEIAGTKVS